MTTKSKRAAFSHLILRSRAQRGVSKDGDALRCSPPFETPAAGGLLMVRPKGKSPFGGTNPTCPAVEQFALASSSFFLHTPRRICSRSRKIRGI
jgi:hypothetical protein